MSVPAPTSYRLDTFAVQLIGRLDATRRTHLDDPDAARQAFGRIVTEAASALARECREVVGDEEQARLLEREAVETFLPRYTRMALVQNRTEARGFGPFGDGPFVRIIATAVAISAATVLARLLPGQNDLLFYFAAALTPIAPEVRVWWSRRAWRAELQELADDLGRVQDAAQALPHADPAVETAAEPVAGTRTRSAEPVADTQAPPRPTNKEVR
jgi:hypothetical protein